MEITYLSHEISTGQLEGSKRIPVGEGGGGVGGACWSRRKIPENPSSPFKAVPCEPSYWHAHSSLSCSAASCSWVWLWPGPRC